MVPKRAYSPTSPDYVTKFYLNLNKWRSETKFTSSLDDILEHDCYLDIVKMGQKVFDFLILELKKSPGLEVYALEDIEGRAPYGEELLGDIVGMTNAWVDEAELR